MMTARGAAPVWATAGRAAHAIRSATTMDATARRRHRDAWPHAMDRSMARIAYPSGVPRRESRCNRRPRQLANLVEIPDVDRDRYVRGVAVVQEVIQLHAPRNRPDHLAETRLRQVLRSPDLQHQGAELGADEPHPAFA